jgi:AAA family ATP:ADP antiporter
MKQHRILICFCLIVPFLSLVPGAPIDRNSGRPTTARSLSNMSDIHQRKSPSFSTKTPPRGGGGGVEVASPAPAATPATDNKDDTTMSSLTKLRRTIFPIYGKQETIKFLLIGSIKFFIIMALTLTRDTKDTLVVTQCGAEAIAFLKVRTRLLIEVYLTFALKISCVGE